jgi:hypothetical protein
METLVPDYLQKLNSHERDSKIQFFEEGHKYLVNGEKDYTSTTTFIHTLFPPFCSDTIIDKMILSGKTKDPSNKYFKMTKEEIKKLWSDKAKQSSELGTNTHYNIECYYNNIPVEDESIEFQYFINYTKDFPVLKPYRTEWLVFDEEHKISGSIDMVYENDDGTLTIADWKRVQEIIYENNFGKKSKIIDIPDTNFWHYSLQLNIYRSIIERNYNKKVKNLYLVVLHPNNKNYEIHNILFMDDDIKILFDWRKQQLSS